MSKIITAYWWEDNDLLVETEDGIYRLVNPYVSSIKYEGLDSTSESVTLIGNNKFWKKTEPPSQSGV